MSLRLDYSSTAMFCLHFQLFARVYFLHNFSYIILGEMYQSEIIFEEK